MPDLNEEIRKLKAEGMSLRRIAAALGVSHVTVLKRWRAMEGDREVVTGKCRKRLPAITEGKDKQATGSISHPSRPCEESRDGGNQVVTQKPPSSPLNESVNPSGNHSRGPLLGMKGLFEGANMGGMNSGGPRRRGPEHLFGHPGSGRRARTGRIISRTLITRDG
jgi:hypothetical protein